MSFDCGPTSIMCSRNPSWQMFNQANCKIRNHPIFMHLSSNLNIAQRRNLMNLLSIPLHFCSVSRQCVTGEEAARWSMITDHHHHHQYHQHSYHRQYFYIFSETSKILCSPHYQTKTLCCRCFEVFSPDQVGKLSFTPRAAWTNKNNYKN